MPAKIVALCIGREKGTSKTPVPKIEIRENFGIVGDVHAGAGDRQVSLLDWESLVRMRRLGLEVSAGDFAENITIWGVRLKELPVGTRLAIGGVLLELTGIGRSCQGPCVAPRNCPPQTEGAFARVLSGGALRSGDTVKIIRPTAALLPEKTDLRPAEA